MRKEEKCLHLAKHLARETLGLCVLESDWCLNQQETEILRQKLIEATLIDLKENYTKDEIHEMWEYWGEYSPSITL